MYIKEAQAATAKAGQERFANDVPLLVEHAVAVPLVIVGVHPPEREAHGEHGDGDSVEEVGEERGRHPRVEADEQHHEEDRERRARREREHVEAGHGVGQTIHPRAARAGAPGLQHRRREGEPYEQLGPEHVHDHRKARDKAGSANIREGVRQVQLGQQVQARSGLYTHAKTPI
jgi:hypothetical protein